jgi:hypothetical protein
MISMILTRDQIILALAEGYKRESEAWILNRVPRETGQERNPIKDLINNIQGAGAEIAVAQWLGLPWNGTKHLGAPDVGSDREVRYSEKSYGHLIVHTSDPLSFLFRDWITP